MLHVMCVESACFGIACHAKPTCLIENDVTADALRDSMQRSCTQDGIYRSSPRPLTWLMHAIRTYKYSPSTNPPKRLAVQNDHLYIEPFLREADQLHPLQLDREPWHCSALRRFKMIASLRIIDSSCVEQRTPFYHRKSGKDTKC